MAGRDTARSLRAESVARLLEMRLEHLVDVAQPMVLIAQPGRSGGTLVSQLLDGHPELHVHPGELQIGEAWPEIELSEPAAAIFKSLRERHVTRSFKDGFIKDKPARRLGYHEQLETFPFMLPPELHRRLFTELFAERAVETQRDVLDLYFTALFNAWLDNQNLYGRPKRWLVTFGGRMRYPDSLARFFRDYPDGRHIISVREPKARTASKIAFGGEGDGVAAYAEAWRLNTEMQLELKARYTDRVFVLTFERLVTQTEEAMRALARWLEIDYTPLLGEPTFNNFPIKANSSFPVAGHGVLPDRLECWRGVLSEQQARTVDEIVGDLYERARAVDGTT
jgi:hypothetical protein